MAAAVIIPNGQGAIGLFVVVAALAIFVLLRVTKWLLQQAPVQGTTSQQKPPNSLATKSFKRCR